MAFTDFLLDNTGDMAIGLDGDFVVGESINEDIYLNLVAEAGEWKQHATIGGQASQWLNYPIDWAKFTREVRLALGVDGISQISITRKNNGATNINARR